MYTFPMAKTIRILTVEREDEDGLIVTFSDGTSAGYVTEELLELRPFRESTESKRSDRVGSDAGPPRMPSGGWMPHPNATAPRTAAQRL